MKSTSTYKAVSINRELSGIEAVPFANTFQSWGAEERVRVSGIQASFNQIFSGFERVRTVKELFGSGTARTLSGLQVGVYDGRGYAWIDNRRGRLRLMISRRYLEAGRKLDLFLDIIHELTHIKQHLDGRDIWDGKRGYFDRPTEIEAYRTAIVEGKKLGMSASEIKSYLRIPLVPKEKFVCLFKNLHLE